MVFAMFYFLGDRKKCLDKNKKNSLLMISVPLKTLIGF